MKSWADGTVWEYAVSKEITLRGRWFDNPGKPILHFVHGNGFCGGMFWPLLSQLSDDYAIFCHDAQGHGDSDDGKRFPGYGETVERITRVISAHQHWFLDRPIIGTGHSFGAICTLLTAARPDNPFDRLLLLDPVLFSKKIIRLYCLAEKIGIARFNPLSRQAKVRGRYWPDRDAAWEYFYQRGIFKGWADEALTAYLDHALETADDGSLSLKCPPWMEAAIFASVPHQLWGAVAKVDVDVTVLFGDKSYGFIAESLAKARQTNTHFSSQMTGGGHCFMQQFPEKTAGQMLSILGNEKPN